MRGGRRWLKPLTAAGVLALVLWRAGPSVVVDALSRIDGGSLAAVSGIALLTTACTSWRWVLVSRGLGLRLTLREAVPASYGSQFLNVSLPTGIAGDVHRGVVQGLRTGDVNRALRSVVWDRATGQTVQLCLAAVALFALPSAVRAPLAGLGAVLGAAALAVLTALLVVRRVRGRSPVAIHGVAADLRRVLARRAWVGVVGASVVAVAGHVTTFLIAARVAGVDTALANLVPLAFIVLLAMAVPVSLAGWGPREGAAAWAFGAAGLGSLHGVTTAVVYGGMVLVASLPGAVVLTATSLRHRVRAREPRP